MQLCSQAELYCVKLNLSEKYYKLNLKYEISEVSLWPKKSQSFLQSWNVHTAELVHEQILNPIQFSTSADVWSLGIHVCDVKLSARPSL